MERRHTVRPAIPRIVATEQTEALLLSSVPRAEDEVVFVVRGVSCLRLYEPISFHLTKHDVVANAIHGASRRG